MPVNRYIFFPINGYAETIVVLLVVYFIFFLFSNWHIENTF